MKDMVPLQIPVSKSVFYKLVLEFYCPSKLNARHLDAKITGPTPHPDTVHIHLKMLGPDPDMHKMIADL